MQIQGHRFLVTGGAGFVGSHIVDRLLDAGAAEVVVFDLEPREDPPRRCAPERPRAPGGRDVTDRERLTAVFAGVDGLFHAAVLPLNADARTRGACLEVNVVGTFNVYEAAREAGVRQDRLLVGLVASTATRTRRWTSRTRSARARWYGASKICGETSCARSATRPASST